MLSRLLLLFIIVPAIELVLLIQMGQWIGVLPTVGLIVITGIAGAYLTRQQGMQVWRRMQQELHSGQMPGEAILEGAMILVAGAVLMTPGVLTDAMGFLLLIPPTRKLMSRFVSAQFQKRIANGQIRVQGFGPMGPMGMGSMDDLGPNNPDVIVIDPENVVVIEPDEKS